MPPVFGGWDRWVNHGDARLTYVPSNTDNPAINNNNVAGPRDNEPPQPANRRPRQRSPCHRNGIVLQVAEQPQKWKFVAYEANLPNNRVHVLLMQLAGSGFNSTTHNTRAWLRSLQDTISLADLDQGDPQHLPSIVHRCATLRSKDVGCAFLMMLSTIQLAFKCQRYTLLLTCSSKLM